MKSKKNLVQICGLALGLLLSAANGRSLTITYIDLLPSGATQGRVWAISANEQVGDQDNYYPTIWSNNAASAVIVNYTQQARILATTGTQQAGYNYVSAAPIGYAGYVSHACIWFGISSYVDLNPPSRESSLAFATSGNQQAGYVANKNGTSAHAAIWSGTAASFIDLNPAGANSSAAYGTTGSQQAGYAMIGSQFNACIWSGSAASYVDLHPAGVQYSQCKAIANGQQAGSATYTNNDHAAIWSGNAASFVDLHPSGATSSDANATTGSAQAGTVVFGTTNHAALWFGTAASFVDLHTNLPASYRDSFATAIWTNGSIIKVGGYAQLTNGNQHPILWTITTSLLPNYNQVTSQLLPGGKVRLGFVGNPGANYALDRSTSLTSVNWSPQATNTADGSGALTFTNTPAAATANFWRVRSVP